MKVCTFLRNFSALYSYIHTSYIHIYNLKSILVFLLCFELLILNIFVFNDVIHHILAMYAMYSTWTQGELNWLIVKEQKKLENMLYTLPSKVCHSARQWKLIMRENVLTNTTYEIPCIQGYVGHAFRILLQALRVRDCNNKWNLQH